MIHIVFTTERFLEVAIESWPEWDLNARLLNSVQTLNRLTYQAMSSTRTQSQLCIYHYIYYIYHSLEQLLKSHFYCFLLHFFTFTLGYVRAYRKGVLRTVPNIYGKAFYCFHKISMKDVCQRPKYAPVSKVF